MEAKTYIKNLKISAKKLRFLLPAIKKLKPVEALDYLFYTPKKAAKIFYKVIQSAISNAKNALKVEEKLLRFKLLTVEEGRKLKRFRPGGRGMAKPILRRFAQVKIILEVEEPEAKKETKQNEVISKKSKVKSDAKRHPERVSESKKQMLK